MSLKANSLNQVLITKLRSKQTAETRQYRKASKALLVLIPLFGLTYLIVLVPPTSDGLDKRIFEITRAILLSTQVSLMESRVAVILFILISFNRDFLLHFSTASLTRKSEEL